ncbi:acyl carrier protein familyprotein [Actinobacteria bacterium OK074]|nr:acyl carrier protein familyprotein [Actinobacteria bacterium OK074]
MYEWLRNVLVERLQLPAAAVTPGATAEAAGLDSLAVTELVLIAKDELGITVDEDELHGLRTVGDMADLLTAHAARTGATT